VFDLSRIGDIRFGYHPKVFYHATLLDLRPDRNKDTKSTVNVLLIALLVLSRRKFRISM
jgi:hypothetical protein